ncbi:MAG: helix-turn-helix transcriptional regulator [Parvibaculaceae bacterium]|nr:helix-turn-helix transcriptional regulator [Parvibaculaceae bacterium]
MEKFTSTGLVGLLVRKLENVDPTLVAGVVKPDPMKRAIEPDNLKRKLIEATMTKHGAGLLLSVGQDIPVSDDVPAMAILTCSRDPAVLAEKWMRLERHHHASHRTLIETERPNRFSCLRTSNSSPATLGENCLIAGLLLGLVGLIGIDDAYIKCGKRIIYPTDLPNLRLGPDETFEDFSIIWSRSKGVASDAQIKAENIPADVTLVEILTDLLSDDIGRSWKICDAAYVLGFSKRSMQRSLSAQGRSFSSILRRARMREATRLLALDNVSLSEVSYCCGYADQAHFQRDFVRATNITPRVFRGLM